MERRQRNSEMLGDSAYSSEVVFEMLEVLGVEPIIETRRNSSLYTRSPARRRAVGRFWYLSNEA